MGIASKTELNYVATFGMKKPEPEIGSYRKREADVCENDSTEGNEASE